MTSGIPTVDSADRLFVFAGAGASIGAPAELPLFDPMRDAILSQLDLEEYIPPAEIEETTPPGQRIAAGLAPEPFMLALQSGDVDVEDWLSRTLRPGPPLSPPRPNAVHVALAQLAAAGAMVWTVNFDTLIEEAAHPRVRSLAWPDPPADIGKAVLKPHGSLPGKLIVTADAVLAGLDDAWYGALRSAVRGRIVIFIGYSGRDIDFHPLWDDLLEESESVIWFDDFRKVQDVERRRRMLRRCNARDSLFLAQPASGGNPSTEFLAWCHYNDLVSIDPDLIDLAGRRPRLRPFPSLNAPSQRAKAAVLGLLGDAGRARSIYRTTLLRGPGRRRAAMDLAIHAVNYGGRPVTAALWGAARLPPSPGRLLKYAPVRRYADFREYAERKRITAHSRLGNYRKVLRATRHTDESTLSTLLLLRSQALRVTGSLDEAADTAAVAYERARREQHNVRAAHAAFQRAMALLWAERVDECRRCVDEDLRPVATIAAARWLAWAEFVSAGVALRERDTNAAGDHYLLSENLFSGEGLLDGVVSAQTARLTLLRMTDPAAFPGAVTRLRHSMRDPDEPGTYYSRGHRFTEDSIHIEEAEYARVHSHDLDRAAGQYAAVARSSFPLQRCLGQLGLGLVAVERAADRTPLQEALNTARRIGARLVAHHAENAMRQSAGVRPAEVFFC